MSAVAGELVKARASVSSFKSSLGKVQSPEPEQIADWSSGLHTLAQSTDGADLAEGPNLENYCKVYSIRKLVLGSLNKLLLGGLST